MLVLFMTKLIRPFICAILFFTPLVASLAVCASAPIESKSNSLIDTPSCTISQTQQNTSMILINPGQTFKATCTGRITAIRVVGSGFEPTVRMDVFEGTLAEENKLGSASTSSNFSTADMNFNFTDAVYVSAGNDYTFVINSGATTLQYASSNPYTDGSLFTSMGEQVNNDLLFEITTVEEEQPECDEDAIVAHPNSVTVMEGGDAQFFIETVDDSYTYQWQINTGGYNWTDIDGATDSSYTMTTVTLLQNRFRFRVVATKGSCITITDDASLTVTQDCSLYSISAQPNNSVILANTSTTFRIKAIGTNLTYRWQVESDQGRMDISDDATYLNADTPTLTITNPTLAMDGYRYRCIVGLGNDCRTASNIATLLVNTAPTEDCDIIQNSGPINTPTSVAIQSFATSCKGAITAIKVFGTASTPKQIELTLNRDNFNSLALVASQIITSSPDNEELLFTFSTPIPVVAGEQFQFIVKDRSSLKFGFQYAENNPYPRGKVLALDNNDTDLRFEITTQRDCTAPENITTLATVNMDITTTQDNDQGTSYSQGCTNLIATVAGDGSETSIAGNVTAKVWIEDDVPAYSDKPFVARHYEITPTSNASTATGQVTLYFTQEEFDNFNSESSINFLPTNPTDSTGIRNLRIVKFPGISSNNSGLPESYTEVPISIKPDASNILWNGYLSRWEITFNVSGFSGYIVNTDSTPLPVTLLSFQVKKQENSALLSWKTTEQTNASHFEVQRSTDAKSFATIKNIPVKGEGKSTENYSYDDYLTSILAPRLYYRLKMVDKDGTFAYSQLRTILIQESKTSLITAYPNPFRETLQVTLGNSSNEEVFVTITSTNGVPIFARKLTAKNGIVSIPSLKAMKAGVYLLTIHTLSESKTLKVVHY